MLNSKLGGSVRASKLSLPSHYINTTAFQDVTQTRLNCVLFGDSYSSYPGTRLALRLAYTPGFPIRTLPGSQAVPAAFRSSPPVSLLRRQPFGLGTRPYLKRESGRSQNSHSPQRISPTPQTGCSSVPTNSEMHSILEPQNIHSMGPQPPVRFNETREYYKRAPLNFIPQAVRGPRFHAQPLFKPKGRTR